MSTLGVLVRVDRLLLKPDQELTLAPNCEVSGLEHLEQAWGLLLK